MLDNEWGRSAFPFVPGHEAVGTIVALGEQAKGLKLGQTVGIGWFSGSCMSCPQCLSGNHNLCPNAEETLIGRHGGFAERLRAHWAWATPLPDKVDAAKAGPLFCGGITVFNPIVQAGVKPTDRVGVIGIGGLGHMALQFLNKWGCEVTAFTTSDSKRDEAMKMGAHNVINSKDAAQMKKIAGSLDFIISTVNAPMDWNTIIGALSPKGRLHFVGAVLEPIPVAAFSLIGGQKTISGSPLGSPATVKTMLDFSARHGIAPVTEVFPMSRVNDALDHLRAGKARYRIVLEADFK
jgi:alcohol/geraniol dehydrogenase (NADP+)